MHLQSIYAGNPRFKRNQWCNTIFFSKVEVVMQGLPIDMSNLVLVRNLTSKHSYNQVLDGHDMIDHPMMLKGSLPKTTMYKF